jgi:hypothetical protein
MPGRGYPRLNEMEHGFEPGRGSMVYAERPQDPRHDGDLSATTERLRGAQSRHQSTEDKDGVQRATSFNKAHLRPYLP